MLHPFMDGAWRWASRPTGRALGAGGGSLVLKKDEEAFARP